MALNYAHRHVNALEKKLGYTYLLRWGAIVNQEKTLRRADDAHHDIRKHLAVHCLATSREADESLAMSEKCGGLTCLLQGEMQTQGITLEALEHEVFLLESQMVGSNLVTRKVLTTTSELYA